MYVIALRQTQDFSNLTLSAVQFCITDDEQWNLPVCVSDESTGHLTLEPRGEQYLGAGLSCEANSHRQRPIDMHGQLSDIWLEYQPHHRMLSPKGLLSKLNIPLGNAPLYFGDHGVSRLESKPGRCNRQPEHIAQTVVEERVDTVVDLNTESQRNEQYNYTEVTSRTQMKTTDLYPNETGQLYCGPTDQVWCILQSFGNVPLGLNTETIICRMDKGWSTLT